MDPKFWSDILQPDVSILEKVVRPVLVYLFLVIGLRLAGKRELAQLNPFDLVVLLTLSNTVQNAIIGSDNSVTGGLIGASTLLLVNYFVVRFFYRHERLERLVVGDPEVLIENGEVKFDILDKELITRTELEAAARKQGFESLDEVNRAVLEPGGTFTFIGKRRTPEMVRHDELLEKLDALASELHSLRLQSG
jgi:uncharacterized membrane protein YcaP (DUF421 family)